MTNIEPVENETLQALMNRMTVAVNASRDKIGYSSVCALFRGCVLHAYGIQQGRNGHKAMQIRWYVNEKPVARTKVIETLGDQQ